MRVLIRCFPVLLVLMGSCSDTNSVESGDIQDSMQAKNLNRIEKETGLDFPDESKLIHFLEPDIVVDPVWVAKVIIPASSFEGFKEVVLRKPTDNSGYSGALADSITWWKPKTVIMKKQYLADRHTLVDIVLSKEGDDFAVYIECAVF